MKIKVDSSIQIFVFIEGAKKITIPAHCRNYLIDIPDKYHKELKEQLYGAVKGGYLTIRNVQSETSI